MLSIWAKCKILSFGKELRYVAVENIVRKGEIACNKQFFLFSGCFLPYMALIFRFECTLTLYSIFTQFDASTTDSF